jgi:Tfp pilus assembly protein PilO
VNRIKELLGKITWPLTIVIVVGYVAFVYFTLDHAEVQTRTENINSVNEQIENHKAEMKRLEQFEKEFDDKKRKFNELVNELQRMQAALPRQFFIPDLVADLYSEADKVKLEIQRIDVAKDETVKPLYNELAFDIRFRATFLQSFVFLDRLANMKRLVNVGSITLKRPGGSNRGNVSLGGTVGAFAETGMAGGTSLYPAIEGEIRVVTYRYKGGASAPVSGGPAAGGAAGAAAPGPRGGSR